MAGQSGSCRIPRFSCALRFLSASSVPWIGRDGFAGKLSGDSDAAIAVSEIELWVVFRLALTSVIAVDGPGRVL